MRSPAWKRRRRNDAARGDLLGPGGGAVRRGRQRGALPRGEGAGITREELTEKLKNIFKNDSWLIDGNYQGTLELRIKECDTIFLLDFPTDICVKGAESRIGTERTDLPWKEDKLDENFKQTIIEFASVKLPEIYHLLDKYKDNRDIVIFKDRDEVDSYIKVLSRKME